MVELRNYQIEAVERILLQEGNWAILWPQGTGKTLVGLEVAKRYIRTRGKKKILITFRNRNVLDTWKLHIKDCKYQNLQFTSMVKMSKKERWRLYSKASLNGGINLIITSETLCRDIEQNLVNLEDFDLIIVDEATKVAAENFQGYRPSIPFRFFKYLNGHRVLLLMPVLSNKERLKKILEITRAKVLNLSEVSNREINEAVPILQREVIKIEDELISYIDKKIQNFLGYNYYKIAEVTGINFSKVNIFYWREKINDFIKNLAPRDKGALIYNFKVIEELNSARWFLFHNKFDSFEKRLKNALERTNDHIYPHLLRELIQLIPKLERKKLEKVVEITQKLVQGNKRVIIYTPFRSIARMLKDCFTDMDISCELFIGGVKIDTQTESKVLVMTKAGGESLNLPQFDVTIYISFPRKEDVRKQVSGRMRGGKEIFLIYKNTIEEEKFEILVNKVNKNVL